LLLALVPRLLVLGRREAWLDEACTGLFAASDTVGVLLQKLIPESHPPLYYLLMYGWTGLFGYSDVVLRVPSLLGGLAVVWLVWKIARVLELGAFYRILAAGAAAFMPLFVYYSVEAKAYTILWALTLAVLHECLLLARPGSRRPLWPVILALTAAVYTHYFGLLAFLAPLWLLAFGPSRRRALVILGLPSLAWLPWALAFLGGQTASGGTAWLARYQTGTVDLLLTSLRLFSGSGPYPGYLGELAAIGGSGPLGMVLVFTPAVAALLYLLPGAWGEERLAELRLLAFFFLASLLVPLLYSLHRPLYLPGRYELGSLGPFLLLWVLGLRLLRSRLPALAVPTVLRRALTGLALGVGLVLGAWGLPAFLRGEQPPRAYQELSQAVQSVGPQTRVLVTGLSYAPVAWALKAHGVPGVPQAFPPALEVHPGWYEPLADDEGELARQAAGQIKELVGHPVLLVGRRGPGAMAFENRHWNLLEEALLGAGWDLDARLGFPGLSGALFVPRAP
jgi:hypothetical protein